MRLTWSIIVTVAYLVSWISLIKWKELFVNKDIAFINKSYQVQHCTQILSHISKTKHLLLDNSLRSLLTPSHQRPSCPSDNTYSKEELDLFRFLNIPAPLIVTLLFFDRSGIYSSYDPTVHHGHRPHEENSNVAHTSCVVGET